MAWNEDILSELPAPNTEEPPSLRRDIADELRDHLQCSAQREALRQSNPKEVEERVIARFGNPKRIARQLWFEAMKEKLMMQKLTLAMVSVVFVASIAAFGFMWSLAREFQSTTTELVAQSRDANADLLQQNQQMMARLTDLSNRDAQNEPSLMEWVPVKVQLVATDDEQSPAVGFTVSLAGKAISTAENAVIKEQSDDSGLADFGLVRPGSYTAHLKAPWGQEFRRSFVAKPGEAHTEIVRCPTEPPSELHVKPVVEWPKELEGQDVALLLQIDGNIVTTIGDEEWQDHYQQYLLVCPDGRLAKYERAFDDYDRTGQPDMEALGMRSVRFYEDPVVFESSLPLRDTSAEFHQLSLVKLPHLAKLPGKNEILINLTESQALDGVFSSKERRPKASYTKPQIKDPGAMEVQDVAIRIRRADAAMARALLAVDEFPKLPKLHVAKSALSFLGYDHDRSLEISREEASRWSEERRNAFPQFPITLPAFISRNVELLEIEEKQKQGS